MQLSQTLAGSWVITTPNPEERGWHTELAEFRMDHTVEGSRARQFLEDAAARLFVALVAEFGDDGEPARITSHSTDAVEHLTAICVSHGFKPS